MKACFHYFSLCGMWFHSCYHCKFSRVLYHLSGGSWRIIEIISPKGNRAIGRGMSRV